jgi:hypothetical protein
MGAERMVLDTARRQGDKGGKETREAKRQGRQRDKGGKETREAKRQGRQRDKGGKETREHKRLPRQGNEATQAESDKATLSLRELISHREDSSEATRHLSHRELREIHLVLKEVKGKGAQAREFLGHRAAPVIGRLQSLSASSHRGERAQDPTRKLSSKSRMSVARKDLRSLRRMGAVSRRMGAVFFKNEKR